MLRFNLFVGDIFVVEVVVRVVESATAVDGGAFVIHGPRIERGRLAQILRCGISVIARADLLAFGIL